MIDLTKVYTGGRKSDAVPECIALKGIRMYSDNDWYLSLRAKMGDTRAIIQLVEWYASTHVDFVRRARDSWEQRIRSANVSGCWGKEEQRIQKLRRAIDRAATGLKAFAGGQEDEEARTGHVLSRYMEAFFEIERFKQSDKGRNHEDICLKNIHFWFHVLQDVRRIIVEPEDKATNLDSELTSEDELFLWLKGQRTSFAAIRVVAGVFAHSSDTTVRKKILKGLNKDLRKTVKDCDVANIKASEIHKITRRLIAAAVKREFESKDCRDHEALK